MVTECVVTLVVDACSIIAIARDKAHAHARMPQCGSGTLVLPQHDIFSATGNERPVPKPSQRSLLFLFKAFGLSICFFIHQQSCQ